MIKLTDISKKYLTDDIETTALQGVNMEIEEGDFVAIMGASGCGKSTLLNIIGMLDKPSMGTYSFHNKIITDMGHKAQADVRKANIGFVFQSFNLIDELSVFDNVELPLVYLKVPRQERKKKVDATLEKMGIAHRAKHFPQQLSGGQQQRVAVARAVVAQPKLLLADEPTGNLDSRHGNEVMELLSSLNHQGTTVVMVTHSDYDAAFAKRIVRLLDGKIISHNEQMPAGSF